MPTIRPAGPRDTRVAADVYLISRAGAGDLIPPGIHDDADVRRYFAEVVFPRGDVWLAEFDHVVGVLVLDGSDLSALYVLPDHQHRGVGSALVEQAKRERPDGLALWAFQSNLPARAFYERHGFTEVRRTDGDNEEGAPDVRYVWGGHPDQTNLGASDS